MPRGSITGYIDVAQLVLYAFWIFFAGLIIYLRREDKREGYPLESDRSGAITVQGFPAVPSAKSFRMSDGSVRTVPSTKADRRDAPVTPLLAWPGSPMEPTGDPMKDGVGPASYADRDDVPERAHDGAPTLVPMRKLSDFSIGPIDTDPRGMTVIAADGHAAGTVKDLWIDRAESLIRYLEVDVPGPAGQRSALLPMTMARIWARRRTVKVRSILATQFADVPALANPDQVTKREEDRIVGYYGGGTLYATPSRMGPVL
jgi:photosynthetic reaction center H subunit